MKLVSICCCAALGLRPKDNTPREGGGTEGVCSVDIEVSRIRARFWGRKSHRDSNVCTGTAQTSVLLSMRSP